MGWHRHVVLAGRPDGTPQHGLDHRPRMIPATSFGLAQDGPPGCASPIKSAPCIGRRGHPVQGRRLFFHVFLCYPQYHKS